MNGWYSSLPRNEALQILDNFLATMESFGFEPMSNPATAANVHAMRGEIAAAADIVLEYLSNQSVATNLDWRRTASLPQFSEVMADPRIEAAVEAWEAEEAELRKDVQQGHTEGKTPLQVRVTKKVYKNRKISNQQFSNYLWGERRCHERKMQSEEYRERMLFVNATITIDPPTDAA